MRWHSGFFKEFVTKPIQFLGSQIINYITMKPQNSYGNQKDIALDARARDDKSIACIQANSTLAYISLFSELDFFK